jgi:membrane associated rhomboid family serine protease
MRSPFGDGFGGGFGGGSARFGPGLSLPPVVKRLLIANAAVFLLSRMIPGIPLEQIESMFGFVAADVFGRGRVWQFATYMFLHGGLFHILFNMLLLWMFGTTVEHRWGSRAFVTYYAVCGLGGAVLSWVMDPGSSIPMIGASAATLGVLLAYTLMYPDQKVLLYFVIPIKMKVLLWLLVAVDLIGAVGLLKGNTAHFAHLGGLLFGYLYLKQDWRMGALGRKFRGARARQQMKQRAKDAERAVSRQEEIDRILEKISAEGMSSLTERELKILREASRR